MQTRCEWCGDDPLYVQYHDTEWGVPCYDDQRFFEMLILEGVQAGLSWITVLRKRENYRAAYDGFDAERIARYDEAKLNALLANPGIIRNRLKVQASVTNARAYLAVKEQFGSFSDYLWQFVNGAPIVNHWSSLREIPAETRESQAMSKDMLKRGFKFVGSTICYAHMQSTGMVNDHVTGCFRHAEVQQLPKG